MEFFCVLSVGGSLASYHLQQIDETTFIAVLKTGSKDTGIPSEMTLRKNGSTWQAQPHHEEIVTGLVHAIESASH